MMNKVSYRLAEIGNRNAAFIRINCLWFPGAVAGIGRFTAMRPEVFGQFFELFCFLNLSCGPGSIPRPERLSTNRG